MKKHSNKRLKIGIPIFLSISLSIILQWQCSNKHTVPSIRLIQVEPDTKLEVIDWGGNGIPVVFLAGLGHTAHVFDEFAPQLTGKYHVFGITRRGFGASSQPDTGYSLPTLVEDIRIVLDSLKLGKVVIAGHSLGGDEMTLFAKKYHERIRALIYIEAAYNRVSAQDSLSKYKVPESLLPKPSKMDSSSVEAYRNYYAKVNGIIMPLSEIQALYFWTPEGHYNGSKTPGKIYGKIKESLRDPDYSGINIPALAIYATQYPLTELFLDYYTCDSTTQQAMRIYHEAALRVDKLSRDYFRARMKQGRVVEVNGAGHSLYITHAKETLSAIQTFLDEMLTEQLDIEKALAFFFQLNYQEALPLLRQIIEKEPRNAEAITWLAETYRRVGKMNAAIENARKALVLNPGSSFTHLVIAQASYPNHDSVYVHVQQAVQCDSTDPNAWLMMWGEAIKHDNPELHNKTLHKLAETGFLTKAALAYGRAELRNLPMNAIYITNGDMDTYPAKIVQMSEGFRTDVAVIEREHLGINWACRFIRDHQNVPLPISDTELDVMRELIDAQGKKISTSEQNFRKWIEQKRRGEFTRPITIAPTVEESFYEFDKEHFHYRGMHLLWQPEAGSEINDTTALRKCLSSINPDDFMGPWASLKDRSPVRRYYTKEIVRNLFWIALTYSKDLITAKRFDEAEKTLQWLDAFEKRTELGPVSTDEIKELRELMNR